MEYTPQDGPLSATKEEADKAGRFRAQAGAQEGGRQSGVTTPTPKAWWASSKFLFVAKQCLTLVTLLTRPR